MSACGTTWKSDGGWPYNMSSAQLEAALADNIVLQGKSDTYAFTSHAYALHVISMSSAISTTVERSSTCSCSDSLPWWTNVLQGPVSEEDTQTDFSKLDVLNNAVAPSTSIDACLSDGFQLNNGLKIRGSGVLLVGGEAFKWRPFEGRTGLLNNKGQWGCEDEAWGVLDLVWPKPGVYWLYDLHHPSIHVLCV